MRRVVVLLGLVASACGSSPSEGQPPPEGAPLLACAPGTRPTDDGVTCAPVGTRKIPEGFEVDGSWGFRAVLPKKSCTGATIALLGAKACQPIDDCTAAFPPAKTTIMVRKSA